MPRRIVPLLALAGALYAGAAGSAEPPDREGLTCTVAKQSLADGLRLEITFTNQSGEPIVLPAGPHLVLYRDTAATEALEVTARIDRLQRTPLTVPAQGRTAGLFGATPQQSRELLCHAGRPVAAAAAGLYFYPFSRRPAFRCLLREASLPMQADCAAGAAP
jgi:hypothetical protein